MIATTDKPRRNTDTRAATLARQMKKWQRWADEMRAAGWTVEEPKAE